MPGTTIDRGITLGRGKMDNHTKKSLEGDRHWKQI